MTGEASTMSETPNSLVDYFRVMFAYDRWATRRVLETLDELNNPPQKSIDRLGHVAAAQLFWLARMGEPIEKPEAIFPSWPVARTRDEAERAMLAMERFVEGLTDARLAEPVTYTATEGGRFTNAVWQILSQLLTHGAYHRGQIAVEINPLLDEPLATDLIVRARRST